MFTHAFLGSNDIEKSRKFYDATMKELGYENVVPPEAGCSSIPARPARWSSASPTTAQPANPSNGARSASPRRTTRRSTRWHQAGLAAGGTDDGAPGPRERAPNNSVGAYLRDPDGNKICAFNMRH